jgi:PAS domain S-box-containing protein
MKKYAGLNENSELGNQDNLLFKGQLDPFIEDVKEYAIYYINPLGTILTWNKGAEKIKGYSREEIIGENFSIFYKPKDIADKKPVMDLKKAAEMGEFLSEDWRIRKDGKLFWASIHITALYSDEGSLLGFTKITRDLTVKRIAEEKLKQQSRQLSIAQKLAHIGSWEWDIETNQVTWSDELYRIYGLKPQEKQITFDLFLEMIHPASREEIKKNISNSLMKPESLNYTEKIVRPDGEIRILHTNGEVIKDDEGKPVKILGSCQDITEAKKYEEEMIKSHLQLETLVSERTSELTRINESLQREITERKMYEEKLTESLDEKELLLKEVHHRVKNNLQVISSLLSLQSGFINNPDAQEVFKESRNRVRSMALVHEKVYKTDNLYKINFREYLTDLVESLIGSYLHGTAVKTEIEIEDIYLNIDLSISLGLIITEITSNAIKYGLKGNSKAKLEIKLESDGDLVTIIIKDNGPGYPDGFDSNNPESLGILLITTLTEQIEGTIEMTNNSGAQSILKFNRTKKEH